ncbi:MBL fold metallo-hydrolase [Cesiribacter andamanensis]|uniref:Metal-dependent hydrolase n=1 Tax=Cesiribacter andamanensis AMV16 TaxID=1279009 RepID=M7N3Q8_9BACT|nr:MBL fold metallo-hydrolase [Cesiribacter andamanensis]EMR01927.1 metal-dependent hydrolase [Cesiribacter andamanensis AMV16]
MNLLSFLFLVLLGVPVWAQSTAGAAVGAQADVLQTEQGAVYIHPVLHGSLVLQWEGKTIFVDPYGGAALYKAFPAPDLVLITDIHGDHLHPETLQGLDLSRADLIAPLAVMEKLGELTFKGKITLANGEEQAWQQLAVRAMPMYNLPETADSRHPKGRGNGYVLTIGKRRLYISGDTEAIPEMRLLTNIDVAFVCMNLPYTMDVEQAAEGVLAFKPRVVYPYHYRGGGGTFSNVENFKQLVAKDPSIEVRLRQWYPQQ